MELSGAPAPELRAAVASNGFGWLRAALPHDDCIALRPALVPHQPAAGRGGVRHIDRLLPAVAQLALRGQLAGVVTALLGEGSHLVRALFFDKSPQQNWLVSWHQDLTVAAASRFDAEGWGPWSQKDGSWHVRPPLAVLQQRLTLRLHLDDCDDGNGCLRVLPGSHLPVPAGTTPDTAGAEDCIAAVGDVLIMSPLLWHASSRSRRPAPRRVLHFEYARHACAAALGWAELERAGNTP